MSSFGVKEIPDIYDVSGSISDFWKMFAFVRIFGAAILMSGILIGFLAYIEGSKNRKIVSLGSASGLLILLLVLFTQQIALLETLTGWSLLAIFLLIFIGFILLAFKKETA
jgi:Ca2+/Na+ antiporter